MAKSPKIIYTWTDEAPALATLSFLPILRTFTKPAGIDVEIRDLSLAGRILAQFADRLDEDQRLSDDLAYLGQLTQEPEANIIKLPNISASMPQLKAAIAELQEKGYPLPDYPDTPGTDEEREIRARYDRVKGSAVNPVLREGNSDRRAPASVKAYARKHPHPMGQWSADSKTAVATMGKDDFRSNEQSVTVPDETTVRIEFVGEDGAVTVLRENIALTPGEVFDATVMRKKALVRFLEEQVERARKADLLFSLHMKATMMKVSDPIIFGHAVEAYFKDLVERHGPVLQELGVSFRNGFGDLLNKLDRLPEQKRREIEADIQAVYDKGPALAMVNSDKGITNLHVPSDIIIDASMPAMIRTSGQMWNAGGKLQDTLAVIPDSSYAGVYQSVIDSCKKHGAFDPRTMGSVPNVGLMAQKAEEYGSHDKTFEIPAKGEVRVVDAKGAALLRHGVEIGDIWRACQSRDAAVRDWVRLAVRRARETGAPAVFWLDEKRAHDAEIIRKVQDELSRLDTSGLEIHILAPTEACTFSLQRIREGKDTISVTGNVLRDYLTDLFPILEVGTSAKMLSIVPLMKGGGLFETGAGGSAPKHVQQFIAENYIRWDSLGEFLALAASLDHLAKTQDNAKARVLAKTLDAANARFLENNKSPTRRLGGIDNRGSHFYLCLYWAQCLAQQEEDPDLRERFTRLAASLAVNEERIVDELLSVQESPVDIGGYYQPDEQRASAAMRPSATFNAILEQA
ncbi:MAG: NADP-dependent isocitrate dehydrogenase [Oceanipulchritudo sp.]